MTEREEETYELFRRAILYRDDDAWAAIHAHYRPLLITWARRHSAWSRGAECADDIADHALARAWAALTPQRFAEFPSLASLLSYLRACVATTAIDCARAQASSERTARRLYRSTATTPEQIVLAGIDRSVLWRTVLSLTATPAERVALVESFAYGLPPRAIQGRHPRLFPDVEAVYGVKRNLLARLQRNRELMRLCDEYVSI
jgi:DNA-directed RNA polymerase specialized sigma24 family protein